MTTEIDQKYDYYHKNWYRTAKELNTSRWSHPYHELSARDIITSTYSVPIHDKQKKVIGIFSVDLSMNWLSTLLDSIKPYEDSYNIILNSEGKYILHPGGNYFFERKLSVFDIIRQMNGSGILLYTDGVTDAENKNEEFYTKERLLQVIRQNHELHPQEFIEKILDDIRKHIKSREQSDDLGMLTLIYGTKWNIGYSQKNN